MSHILFDGRLMRIKFLFVVAMSLVGFGKPVLQFVVENSHEDSDEDELHLSEQIEFEFRSVVDESPNVADESESKDFAAL